MKKTKLSKFSCFVKMKNLFFDKLCTKTTRNTFNSQNRLFLVEIELAQVEIFESPCKKIKKSTRNPLMPIDGVHTCLGQAT
jgi:hypothetical protein